MEDRTPLLLRWECLVSRHLLSSACNMKLFHILSRNTLYIKSTYNIGACKQRRQIRFTVFPLFTAPAAVSMWLDHPRRCSALMTLKHDICLPLRFHRQPCWILCTSLQTPVHGKYKSVYSCYRSWHLKEISYRNESKVNCSYLFFAIQKYRHNSSSEKTKLYWFKTTIHACLCSASSAVNATKYCGFFFYLLSRAHLASTC